MSLFDKKLADRPLIGFVPFIFSSHCVSPSWAYFLLNDFFLSAILWTCRHTICEGPYFKAACLSFGRLKLFNTCSMNYITVPHMDSLLRKHTHLACMRIFTVQMETNHWVMNLTSPLLAFSVCGQTWVKFIFAVLCVCFILLGVTDA